MTDDEFFADRCRKSELPKMMCACCLGFANVPTPGDPHADETPRMQPLGSQGDRASTRCPGCLEELQIGESTRVSVVGDLTHSECAA